MSSFAKNLQFYRNRENLTQEQLAEQLGVSRQTVSKWEAGTSYAEMEKLLQLCDLFSCDMDTLMRKDASAAAVEDNQKHRKHMKEFRKGICSGIACMILDVALYELLAGFAVSEIFRDALFMAIVIVAVLILIVQGMKHDYYRKKNPEIQDFYTDEEKEELESRFPTYIAVGVGMILIGVLIGMNGENLPLAKGMKEDFYYGVFMILVAAAVTIFTYCGMRKDEYDVEKYNRENNPDPQRKEKNSKIGVWCGCIMIAATIIFLVSGLVFQLWEICWIVYVIGGLLCGIVSLIINKE